MAAASQPCAVGRPSISSVQARGGVFRALVRPVIHPRAQRAAERPMRRFSDAPGAGSRSGRRCCPPPVYKAEDCTSLQRLRACIWSIGYAPSWQTWYSYHHSPLHPVAPADPRRRLTHCRNIRPPSRHLAISSTEPSTLPQVPTAMILPL